MKAQILATPDLYLHIATGRFILTHHVVPDYGIFSGSLPAVPWVQHEWLASTLFALIYDQLGWGGIVALTALLLALAIGILAAELSAAVGAIGALSLAALGWGLCLNHLLARPHVFSLPLLVIWIAAHVTARRKDRAPPLYLLPVMTLWANLHGGFALGLLFTGLFGAEAVFETKTGPAARQVALRWAVFFALALIAASLTPHGLKGLLFPVQMLSTGAAARSMINEWQPATIVNDPALFIVCFILIFGATAYGLKLPIWRLTMLLVLLYLGFAHRRYAELVGLAAPLCLADAIGLRLAQTVPPPILRLGAVLQPRTNALLLSLAVVATGATTLFACHGMQRGPDRFTPDASLAAVAVKGVTGPVFNAFNFGDYLAFRGFAPFVDGRVDMYGDAFMEKYRDPTALPVILQRYHIAWTLLEARDAPRILVMDHEPGWVRVYADSVAVVHRRAAP